MRHAHILLCVVLIFTFSSCKKDPPVVLPTIIKGIVVDDETREPISAAGIFIQNRLLYANGQETTVSKYIESDSEGHFFYTVRPDAKSSSLYSITAKSYASKLVGYQEYSVNMEATNEFTIPLIKLDAVLQIYVRNQHDIDKNVHVVVSNPTCLSEARYVGGEYIFSPLNIQIGEEDTLIVPVKSKEFTTIYWGNNAFYPFETAPYHDELYLNEGETLSYSIEF